MRVIAISLLSAIIVICLYQGFQTWKHELLLTKSYIYVKCYKYIH